MHLIVHGYAAYRPALGEKYPLDAFASRALTYGRRLAELADDEPVCVVLPDSELAQDGYLRWLTMDLKLGPAEILFVPGKSLIRGMAASPQMRTMLETAASIEFFCPLEEEEEVALCDLGISWSRVQNSPPTLGRMLNSKVLQRQVLSGMMDGEFHSLLLPHLVLPAHPELVQSQVRNLLLAGLQGARDIGVVIKGENSASGDQQLYLTDPQDQSQHARLKRFLAHLREVGVHRVIVEQALMDTERFLPVSMSYRLGGGDWDALPLHASRQLCRFHDYKVIWEGNVVGRGCAVPGLDASALHELRACTMPIAQRLYEMDVRGYVVFDCLYDTVDGRLFLLEINLRPTFSLFGRRVLDQVMTDPRWHAGTSGAVTITVLHPQPGSGLKGFADLKACLGERLFAWGQGGIIPYLVGGLAHAENPVVNLVAVGVNAEESMRFSQEAMSRLREYVRA